jgi:hypothetical protein
MPKVTKTVARIDSPKACPRAKAGQPYYWWRTWMKGARSGVTRCSLSYPRPSQLTQSEFYSAVYALQEAIEDFSIDGSDSGASADLQDAIVGWADEAHGIADEQREKRENMPYSLQDGDVGQLLEARADECEAWADAMRDVVIPERDEFDDGEDGDNDYEQALQDALADLVADMPTS